MDNKIKRRKLIEFMSKGVASTVLLPSLLSQKASAQTGGNNRKLLFVYADGGATHRFMDMRPSWSAAASADPNRFYDYNYWRQPDNREWEFSFTDPRLTQDQMSRVLRPFWSLRDKLTYLEGISMTSTGFDNTANQGDDAHAQAHIGCINGTAAAYAFDGVKSAPIGPSIDQRINAFLKETNPQHRSLNYRLNVGDWIFHEYLHYDPGNGQMQRVPVEINPVTAFNRLFDGMNAAPNPMDQNRAAIFQMLNGEYSSLANRLSGDDRIKLQTHRELLNVLEQSMGSDMSCGTPTPPSSGNGLSRADRQQWMIDSFARMTAAAFSCGVSRVGSIGLADIPTECFGLPPGISIHQEYEHNSGPRAFYEHHSENPQATSAGRLWAAREEAMVQRNIWQAERVADIANIFANTPDSSGNGSLLDSTLIVYVSEISHGLHGHDHWPVITLGDFGGAVSAGRYIKYAQNHFQTRYYWPDNDYIGIANTKFFISLCQAMGMEIDYLHEPRIRSVVRNFTNQWTDLSGPLPRLRL